MSADRTLVECSRCKIGVGPEHSLWCNACGKTLCSMCWSDHGGQCETCNRLDAEAAQTIACGNCKKDISRLAAIRCHKCGILVCDACWDIYTYKCRSCRIAEEQLSKEKGADE